ncbi:MAG: hypothetical protein LUC16_00130 [Coprobacillus sp.]|nr:hypothetical protein [Coprobacillus sp.]
MKKSKRNVSLVTGIVAALCLSSCTVTPSDTAIVTFTGYNGEEIALITNDFYEKYRNTEDGVMTFYNAIMEVLTRYVFEQGYVFTKGDLDECKNLEEIKVEADKNVLGAKQDCKDQASDNGTSYDKEWDAYLEGLGLEDEDELLEYFIYNIEKEEIEDWYFDNNVDELKEEYIGVSDTGEEVVTSVRSAFPYHVRHILVNVSDESSSFTRSVITESEANKLSTVLTMLNDGILKFGDIAYNLSDDTASAEVYGDAGIMDTTTSFVNEFKLGLYAYDATYAGHTENPAIEDGLGLSGEFEDTTVKEEVSNIKLGYVPYGVFDLLKFYSDTEKDENGLDVNDGNTASYPRNIIWNEYLNKHSAFVITNEGISDSEELQALYDDSATDKPEDTLNEESARWQEVDGITTNDQKVLCDEQGRVIIGVRSEYGIHLMVIQKSIYDFNEGEDGESSLEDYYTTFVPGDDEYPTYTDANGVKQDKDTYVNFLSTTDQSIYKERANDVESLITSFDTTYSYRLYEYFVSKGSIQFTTQEGQTNIGDQIEKMIKVTREQNLWNAEKTLNDSWRTYLEMLEVQEEERAKEGRLVDTGCVVGFAHANSSDSSKITLADWEKGGKCYVE